MALTLQTKDVLPMLAERGISTHREAIAEMSDLLGLHTRAQVAPWSPRRWGPTEVELLAVAFHLKREWTLSLSTIEALAAGGEEAVDELAGKFRAALGVFLDHIQAAAAAARSWETEPAEPTVLETSSQAQSDAA